MSQLLVPGEAGQVADRIRSMMGDAGFTIRSDQSDSVQIGPAGQLGERHNVVFERQASPPEHSELVQVWVVEAGGARCAVTVLPDGVRADSVLGGIAGASGGSP